MRIWRILYLYLQKYQGQCLWSVCIPRHPNKLYNIIVPIITIIVLIIISWSVCNIQTSNYTWYLTWTLSESSTSSSDLFVSLDIQLYLTYDIAQSHWCPIRVSSMALLVMLNMIRKKWCFRSITSWKIEKGIPSTLQLIKSHLMHNPKTKHLSSIDFKILSFLLRSSNFKDWVYAKSVLFLLLVYSSRRC